MRSAEQIKAYQDEYRARHREYSREYGKLWRSKNPDKIKAKNDARASKKLPQDAARKREYYNENKEEIKAYQVEYRKKNADILREKDKLRKLKNRDIRLEKMKVRSAKYYAENKERLKPIRKAWNENNKHRLTAKDAKRRSAILSRSPKWADLSAIREVFLKAEIISKLGKKVHVDHIIPLQGKLVSGLHVASNLEVIGSYENRVKANKFDPNSWVEPLPGEQP